MLKNEPTDIKKYDGKFYGIYRGVVIDNDDSEEWEDRFEGGTGRVRVRVWGIHTPKNTKEEKEGIPDSEIPWAEPVYPIIEGSLTDYGMWSVPVLGTHVFVFFENGDHMQPRYFGCAPGVQPEEIVEENDNGFVNADWIRTDRLGEPDYSKVARGEIEDTFIENMNDNIEPIAAGGCSVTTVEDDEADIGNYPHILSLETHGGHALTFDSTPDDKKTFLYHPAKSWLYIDNDGTITIHSEKDTVSISLGDRKIGVKGGSERAINGSEKTGVNGSWTVDVAGTATIYATSVLLGSCGGSGSFKTLSTSDHVHTEVTKGNDTSGPPTQNTSVVKAN